MPRDPNKNYTNVLIKIGTQPILQGSVHYKRSNTEHVEFKMNAGAPAGTVQQIEDASEAHNLFINALPPSATNPDFQHKSIRYVKADGNRKKWEFAFV